MYVFHYGRSLFPTVCCTAFGLHIHSIRMDSIAANGRCVGFQISFIWLLLPWHWAVFEPTVACKDTWQARPFSSLIVPLFTLTHRSPLAHTQPHTLLINVTRGRGQHERVATWECKREGKQNVRAKESGVRKVLLYKQDTLITTSSLKGSERQKDG